MVSWRKPGLQPVQMIPTALRGFLFFALAGCMSLPLSAADGIATVQENGRTVYVNSDELRSVSRSAAPAPRLASTAPRYKYWSSVEHCWKYVRPTPAALTAARSAAALWALRDRLEHWVGQPWRDAGLKGAADD